MDGSQQILFHEEKRDHASLTEIRGKISPEGLIIGGSGDEQILLIAVDLVPDPADLSQSVMLLFGECLDLLLLIVLSGCPFPFSFVGFLVQISHLKVPLSNISSYDWRIKRLGTPLRSRRRGAGRRTSGRIPYHSPSDEGFPEGRRSRRSVQKRYRPSRKACRRARRIGSFYRPSRQWSLLKLT